MSEGTPDVAELFRLAGRQSQARVHTSIPGYVEKVHTLDGRNGQWVDVLPAIKVTLPGPDGLPVEEELPKLCMVPVGYMQGGGFFVSVPLKPGDHVLLQFCERSLDQWVQKAKRGRRQAVSPGHAEIHGLNGAVALPVGPPSRQDALQDVDAADLVIGLDGDDGAQIRITPGGEIHLGGSAEYVALATQVSAKLDAIVDAINNVTVFTASDGGAAAFTALKASLVGFSSSVAASTTKAG